MKCPSRLTATARLRALQRAALSSLLSVLLAVGPVWPAHAFENAAPVEAFTFGDQSASSQLRMDAGAKANAAKARSVPVSSSGTYTRTPSPSMCRRGGWA